MSRATVAGIWALAVALVVLLVTHLPPDVLRDPAARARSTTRSARPPAPTATQVPLISVEGAETFPTDGRTRPAHRAGRAATASARRRGSSSRWRGSTRARRSCRSTPSSPRARPPRSATSESAAMMVDSQKEATAAALTELGYDVEPADLRPLAHRRTPPRRASSRRATSSSRPTATPVTDAESLREIVNAGDGEPDRAAHRARRRARRPSSVTPKEVEVDGETTLAHRRRR